jgi:hypothetical protein
MGYSGEGLVDFKHNFRTFDLFNLGDDPVSFDPFGYEVDDLDEVIDER